MSVLKDTRDFWFDGAPVRFTASLEFSRETMLPFFLTAYAYSTKPTSTLCQKENEGVYISLIQEVKSIPIPLPYCLTSMLTHLVDKGHLNLLSPR